MALDDKIAEILGGIGLLEMNERAAQSESTIDYANSLYGMVAYTEDVDKRTLEEAKRSRTLENSSVAREETDRAYRPKVTAKIENKAFGQFEKLIKMLAHNKFAFSEFIAPYSEEGKPLNNLYAAIESKDISRMKEAVITADPTNFLNIFLINERSEEAIERVAQMEYMGRLGTYISDNFVNIEENPESGELESKYDPDKAITYANEIFSDENKKKDAGFNLAKNIYNAMERQER
jgi:hypothetical protein